MAGAVVLTVLACFAVLLAETQAKSIDNDNDDALAKLLETLAAKHKHDSSDHSGSREQNNEESFQHHWRTELREKCGIAIKQEIESEKKVSLDEVKEAFSAVSDYAGKVATDFSAHEDDINALESYLDSSDVTDSGSRERHEKLVTAFFTTAVQAGKDSLCSYGRLVPLRIRLAFYGTEGFATNTACNKFAAKIMKLLLEHQFNFKAAANAVTAEWFHSLGADLRDDMRCLIRDIGEYSHALKGLKLVSAEWNLRQVSLAIDGVSVYGAGIAREVQGMMDGARGLTYLVSLIAHPQQREAAVPLLGEDADQQEPDSSASRSRSPPVSDTDEHLQSSLKVLLKTLQEFKKLNHGNTWSQK